jgi:uncharacterized membrane protein
MTDSSIPSYVVVICFASGLLLVALGVPLWLRRVPPNFLYGVRFRSTLSDDGIWYAVNGLAGRNMIGIGAGYLVLLTGAVAFATPWDLAIRLLVPTAILVVALIVNTIVLSNAGARLLAAHNAAKERVKT